MYILNYDSEKKINFLISTDDTNTQGLILRTAYISTAYISTNNNTHAIVGIKTDSEQYVYDSNNHWEYEEWDKLPFKSTGNVGYMKNYGVYGSIDYKIYSSEPYTPAKTSL